VQLIVSEPIAQALRKAGLLPWPTGTEGPSCAEPSWHQASAETWGSTKCVTGPEAGWDEECYHHRSGASAL